MHIPNGTLHIISHRVSDPETLLMARQVKYHKISSPEVIKSQTNLMAEEYHVLLRKEAAALNGSWCKTGYLRCPGAGEGEGALSWTGARGP